MDSNIRLAKMGSVFLAQVAEKIVRYLSTLRSRDKCRRLLNGILGTNMIIRSWRRRKHDTIPLLPQIIIAWIVGLSSPR